VRRLRDLVAQDQGSQRAKEVVGLMFQTALLTSGFDLTSPKEYAGLVYEMMDAALAPGAPTPAAAGDGTGSAVDADEIIEEGK